MTVLAKAPTHIDYAQQMARIAAEMAGYKLDDLRISGLPKDPQHQKLYRAFVKKGFEAVELLAPAVVSLDSPLGDKVPEEVRRAGEDRGEHALATVRLWRGMSIDDLAEAAGLSSDLVGSNEAREIVSNEMQDAALATALNVSPHAITDWRVILD